MDTSVCILICDQVNILHLLYLGRFPNDYQSHSNDIW